MNEYRSSVCHMYYMTSNGAMENLHYTWHFFFIHLPLVIYSLYIFKCISEARLNNLYLFAQRCYQYKDSYSNGTFHTLILTQQTGVSPVQKMLLLWDESDRQLGTCYVVMLAAF